MSSVKSQVLAACRHLLAPVVRLLLRSGVSWNEFAELGKQVFVEVARRDYGVQGRPTNNARVAMITGLSRREVARLRDAIDGATPAAPPTASRISQVLSGWHLDEEFLDALGRPALLSAEGEQRSVAALLRRYAGDLPHGAFLKELLQLGLVEKVGHRGYRLCAREYLRSPLDPDILRQLGVALRDHATTLVHNVDAHRTAPARFEGMASTPRLAPRYARAFAEFAAARGQALLEEIDAWLLKHETKGAGGTAARGIRVGFGAYLIREEMQRGRRT
jgi:hypothetical protein